MFVSTSDQHFGSSTSSSGFVTTLPIEVNVTQNQVPTMMKTFTINESSGSNDNNNGLGVKIVIH